MSNKSRMMAAARVLGAGLLAVTPLASQAGPIAVYVGYADSLRPSPFFPTPYDTADIFQGNLGALDTGAVRIQNTGVADISLNDLSVQVNPGLGGQVFKLWDFGSGAGVPNATGLVLHPGQNAVFGSTANYNFDTSDFGVLGSFALNNNNCSIGPNAATALCVDNAPLVTFVVDNVAVPLLDTGHVLDTGGFDFVNANPCPVAGDSPGACNESLQWRLIGTTGIQDPGGNPNGVPEPGTLALLSLGLMGVGRTRKFLRA